jgi:hypothetical protein
VVPKDHPLVLAEVAHQPLLLLELQGDALVVVIRDLREAHRGLRDRQQPALHGRHGHAGDRVRVNDAVDIVPRGMDATVHDVAGLVDLVLGRVE